MHLGIFMMLCAIVYFLGWLIDEVRRLRKAVVAVTLQHHSEVKP